MNNTTLKLRFRLLSSFGSIPNANKMEEKENKLREEYNALIEFQNSEELQRFENLKSFIESDEFKERKKEINSQKYQDTEEYRKEKRFKELARDKAIKNYLKLKDSEELNHLNEMISSGKLDRFYELHNFFSSADFKKFKKELEQKRKDKSKEYKDTLKKYEKLKKKKDKLKDPGKIQELEKLEDYVNSSDFKDLEETIDNLKFENTSEYKDLQEYKELKKSPDISNARKLKESKNYEQYLGTKDSDLPGEYEDLQEFVNTDEFKDVKEQMTRKDKFKHSQEYQDYLEYKELKNSEKIKWYYKRKDSGDFDFFRNWEHSFYDNFEGNELDTSKWLTTPFWAKHLLKDSYVQSDDKHFFTNGNNISVDENRLKIITRKEKIEGKAWHPKFGFFPKKFNYTSGMINTAESFRQRYGIFRAKVKIDNTYPFNHSFWLIHDKISPEIDIFSFSDKSSKKVQLNNYWGNVTEKNGLGYHKQKIKGPDFTKNFYIYSLEWSNNALIWKINGITVKKQTQGVPEIPLYLVLNSGLREEVDERNLPATMSVDWVEVYKQR